MVERRKLASRAAEERFKYEWSNFFGLTVATVESEITPSIGRIANSLSPEGQYPDVIILYNPEENRFTVLLNNKTVEDSFALKYLRTLESDLNCVDEVAKYGGSKWRINMQKGNLQSPNHGFTTYLNLGNIITVIGIQQYFRELKRMRNIILLPLPGQVEATLRKRGIKKASKASVEVGNIAANAMPVEFIGTVKTTSKGISITLQGSS